MGASELTPLKAAANECQGSLVADLVYEDEDNQMTFGRRLARWLSRFSRYNPHLDSQEATKPSVDVAWAYFEHVTLARYFVEAQKPGSRRVTKDTRRKAEAGELHDSTLLYPVLSTPESDLADFGLGIGMYFFTLRALAIIMLIAGLINIPNMCYFGSKRYNGMDESVKAWSLKASAICTNFAWKSCPTCSREDWDRFPATYERYAEALSENNSVLRFTKTNQCDVGSGVGFVAYISLLFVCLSIYILQKLTYRKGLIFDACSQTTSDYSVEVQNPPKDARDVEEWKTFFSQFGQVTCCTVALDNEELVAALISRRIQVNALQNLQPPHTMVDPRAIDQAVETALPIPWYLKMIFSDAQVIKERIAKIDESIKNDLGQRKYDVSNVFVIFETEAAQQLALKEVSVKGIDFLRHNCSSLPEKYLFRGQHLIYVIEPQEPSSVRWQDLDEKFSIQLRQRFVAFCCTVLLIILSCLLVVHVRFKYGIIDAALTITAINSGTPTICQYITNLESHASEGSKQASLYCKITACVWITSSIITAFVTPFVDSLNDEPSSLIPAICAIFFTEMFKAPVTQLFDVSGNINRHYFGPRAPDQRRMNGYFQGTAYQLSERYTDMTKVLFMTFYYASIFPAGFFFAAITLTVHYWVDKFCLLRSWAQAPMLGTRIAEMSRIYFFSSAVAVYAIMTSYNFASFPYDNACQLNATVPTDYVGTFQATTGDGNEVTIAISDGDSTYKYCNQDMSRYHPPAFPAIPQNQPRGGEWMGPDQEVFTYIFGWTSIWVIVFVIAIWMNVMRKSIKDLLFTTYKPHLQKERNESFSEIKDLVGYVPQAKVVGEIFPVLLCDVNQIDHDLIGWEDLDDMFKKTHNAIYDVEGLADHDVETSVFSIVKHWKTSQSGNAESFDTS